jgi:hypothetical protein
MKNKKPMIARVILKINKKSYRKQVNKNKTNRVNLLNLG